MLRYDSTLETWQVVELESPSAFASTLTLTLMADLRVAKVHDAGVRGALGVDLTDLPRLGLGLVHWSL